MAKPLPAAGCSCSAAGASAATSCAVAGAGVVAAGSAAASSSCVGAKTNQLPPTLPLEGLKPIRTAEMCVAAIWWARLDRVFYANALADTAHMMPIDGLTHDEIAATVILLTHLEHAVPTAQERLEGGFLGNDRGAEHRVLVDFHHRLDDRLRRAGVTETEAGHRESLGESVQQNRPLLHPGQ